MTYILASHIKYFWNEAVASSSFICESACPHPLVQLSCAKVSNFIRCTYNAMMMTKSLIIIEIALHTKR